MKLANNTSWMPSWLDEYWKGQFRAASSLLLPAHMSSRSINFSFQPSPAQPNETTATECVASRPPSFNCSPRLNAKNHVPSASPSPGSEIPTIRIPAVLAPAPAASLTSDSLLPGLWPFLSWWPWAIDGPICCRALPSASSPPSLTLLRHELLTC